jgi:UDP-glucose 4-epimerase
VRYPLRMGFGTMSGDRKILVTGGAGFIGSHLTDYLTEAGNKVFVLDDYSTGSDSNLNHLVGSKNLEVIKGSILDYRLVESIVAECDHIFHLGAAVGVSTIMNYPLESFKTNIEGTENILTAALAFKRRVLFTSSSEIYGKNTGDALSENSDRILGSPEKFRWLYSEAKAIDESFAQIYYRKGLDVRIVRLFNTVGPRQSASFGMVLPNFVNSALRNDPLVVHGDGSQTRCFVHVQDVVNALNLVMNKDNLDGEVFNIGNPEEISILELAELVISSTKSLSKIHFKPHSDLYPAGFEDMIRRVPNIEKIRTTLNWSPTFSLTRIVNETIAFHQQNS